MPNYRRALIPGGTFFFTVNLANRNATLLIDRIDVLRCVFADTQREHGFMTEAIVVLPDHLHCVLTLPPADANFPLIWNKIKSRFSRRLNVTGPRSTSKIKKRERGIWQRRYWEHMIRDAQDYQAHVTYCWINPVKHGLVRSVRDWPFSSFHRDVRRGIVSADFAGAVAEGVFGEAVGVR